MSFNEYCLALDCVPQATVWEMRMAKRNLVLAGMIKERDQQRNKLWMRWCAARGIPPRLSVEDILLISACDR